ncbi:acetoin reductase family protein [Hysterangium stoloniferum]|nr:acetoin reductase family protein [Hysterangium stoloniferum]
MADNSTTRVAVVTGACHGIGRAIALRFAEDGLDLVVSDMPKEADTLNALVSELIAKGRKCVGVVGNPTQEADVQKIVDTAVNELGGLDVMVANAGIGISNPIVDVPVDEWDHVQAFNLRSAFLCYKAAAIQMIKQGRGGRIIGATSIISKQGGPEWAAYSANVSICSQPPPAGEWRKYGITVNTYAPGAVDIPQFHSDQNTRAAKGEARTEYPVVSPKDIAALASYLARDETKLITGQSISINGGVQFD